MIAEVNPKDIIIGNVNPKTWRQFTPRQILILKGMMDGRVIRIHQGKEVRGRYIRSWFELFSDPLEAAHALGEEVLEKTLALQIDHIYVKLGAAKIFNDRKSAMTYKTWLKSEGLLRQLPARFTWEDVITAHKYSNIPAGRASLRSVAGTLYLHIIGDNIDYIPNPLNKTNPSFRKTNNFLEPETL